MKILHILTAHITPLQTFGLNLYIGSIIAMFFIEREVYISLSKIYGAMMVFIIGITIFSLDMNKADINMKTATVMAVIGIAAMMTPLIVEAVIEKITSEIQGRKSSRVDIKADPVKDEKLKESKEVKVELPKAVAPKLTLEQLRAGCVEGSGLGKGMEIKKLLNEKYDVKKLDALSDERYLDFANDLRELGVRI